MPNATVDKEPPQPAKKLSFIRRFSLSSSQHPSVEKDVPPPLPQSKITSRSTSGPVDSRGAQVLAGPPYQPYPQPPAWGEGDYAATAGPSRVVNGRPIQSGPNWAVGGPQPHSTTVTSRGASDGGAWETERNARQPFEAAPAEIPSYSGAVPHQGRRSLQPETRNTIYPALASPPSSPPRDEDPLSSRFPHLSIGTPPIRVASRQPVIPPSTASAPWASPGDPAVELQYKSAMSRQEKPPIPTQQKSSRSASTPTGPSAAARTPHITSNGLANGVHQRSPPLSYPAVVQQRHASEGSSSRTIATDQARQNGHAHMDRSTSTSVRVSREPNADLREHNASSHDRKTDSYDTARPAKTAVPPQAGRPPVTGESEASAYAKAISNSILHRQPERSPTSPVTQTQPAPLPQRRSSRPLPRTPGRPGGVEYRHNSPSGSSADVPSMPVQHARTATQSGSAIMPGGMRQSPIRASGSGPIQSRRSDSSAIPPLLSRSHNPAARQPSATSNKPPQSIDFSKSPQTDAIANDRRNASSPRKREVSTTQSEQLPPYSRIQESSVANLYRLISQPRIQAALLSQLTINSFLSLLGTSEHIRRAVSGELVGRWVLAAWDVAVQHEKGRSWPNLQVWEGFLESLLHDPSTYATYPKQWQPLLEHLCLSHTLIVLHLRGLPPSAFPDTAPSPFEDDPGSSLQLPASGSASSLVSFGAHSRSRISSRAGSDAGSMAPTQMPRQERLIEIAMPEPLAAKQVESLSNDEPQSNPSLHRRGSIASLASAKALVFSRKRSHSVGMPAPPFNNSSSPTASSNRLSKNAPPPISYPSPKRYGFKQKGNKSRSRTSSESTRPGSFMSMHSNPSIHAVSLHPARRNLAIDTKNVSRSVFPMASSSSAVMAHRGSFAGSDAGRSSHRSDIGTASSAQSRSFPSRFPRLLTSPLRRVEPAFDLPIPYMPGRAPLLRVFVPLSDSVRHWPSAEGASAAVHELNKCGALKRLQLGDLVINTAIRQPQTTEHVLLFVPFIKHKLVPLEYRYCRTGHLPAYLDAFVLSPTYYHPFLPSPQILFLNVAPFVEQAQKSLRLAFDRRDVVTASGAILNAKRYLHVAGFEVTAGATHIAPEWCGMVTLEAEGTAEGRRDLERRIGRGDPTQAVVGPWEVVREKSMLGAIWLRLVPEAI